MNRFWSLAVLALALGGCINVGDKQGTHAVVHYVLGDAGAERTGPASATRSGRTLLVLDTVAPGFYGGDQLVFSRSVGTRGQYQFARWTERPGKRFAALMRSRLEQAGWQVATSSGYGQGDLLLDTALVDFYHDAAQPPGRVRLVVRAELVDVQRRILLERRTFEADAEVASYDAAGAAAASGVAVGKMLDDMSAWLATYK